jgi:hypothetical protein
MEPEPGIRFIIPSGVIIRYQNYHGLFYIRHMSKGQ